MDHGKKLGLRTFIYYCITGAVPGLLLIILSVFLPNITEFITTKIPLNITTITIDNINKIGHVVIALLFVLGFLIIFFGLLFSFIRYVSTTYTLEDNAFKSRRGLIGKMEILIPYKQIQAVNVNQSIVFRILGLSSLSVLSAGNTKQNEDADEVFGVIDSSIAKYLQEELLKRSNIQEVKEV